MPSRGVYEVTCTACGATVEVTQRPDYGTAFVCMRCQARGVSADRVHGFTVVSDPLVPVGEVRFVDAQGHGHRLYDASVEDEEQQP